MNVLLTGGTGVVGQPFVRKILREGWHVTLLTRDPRRAAGLVHPNLIVCGADVADASRLETLFRGQAGFDAVYHLAASLDYFGDGDDVYRTNV